MEKITEASCEHEKPYRLIMKMRNEEYRPLVRRMADVLALIETEGLVPIGPLRGKVLLLHIAGFDGALSRVEGETSEERFGIAVPFATHFFGTDGAGARRKYPILWLADTIIMPDGDVRLRRFPEEVWVRAVNFSLPKLPFEWSENKVHLTTLISRYANDTGLALEKLGREMATDHLDFEGLARLSITRLDPLIEYIHSIWPTIYSDRSAPSRETISATLAELSMRARSRGRNSIKR